MAPDRDWFLQTVARDPRHNLRLIGEGVQKYGFSRKELPEVTVFLQSGASVTGKVIRCDSDRDGEYISLSQGEDESDPSLVYILLSEVTALQIRRASTVAAIFNASASVPSGPAPTRLQLKREFEKLAQTPSSSQKGVRIDYAWPDAEESEEVRFHLAEVAQALDRALKKIAAEPLGAEALGKTETVMIRNQAGAALATSREGACIALRHDLRRPLPSNLDEQLQKGIESVL